MTKTLKELAEACKAARADSSIPTKQYQVHRDAYIRVVTNEANILSLLAENERLREALSVIVEIEEGPGETDRPHMIAARAALAKAPQ